MIEFKVYGTPAPQGSKRFVGVSKAGRGLMVESSKKVKPWRMDVKEAAEQAKSRHGDKISGPVGVAMVFTLRKPSSAPKTRRTFPDKKPDISKLVRSTEDAITDAGLWEDDSRVVEMTACKRYVNEGDDALDSPGVVIRIWQISEATHGL